jgi:hypothetical protein
VAREPKNPEPREPNLAESDWWALHTIACDGPLPPVTALKRLYVEGLIFKDGRLTVRGVRWARVYRETTAERFLHHFAKANT